MPREHCARALRNNTWLNGSPIDIAMPWSCGKFSCQWQQLGYKAQEVTPVRHATLAADPDYASCYIRLTLIAPAGQV
jgi:hypothetical protein